MSIAPDLRLQALPLALIGPDTAFNRALGDRTADTIRRRLSPEPMPVSWNTQASPPVPLPLEPEERRLVQAFAYLITEQKKSTPRFEKMQELYQRYPSEDLAEMMLTYVLSWNPETARILGEAWLLAHPDSLGLRLNLALLALARSEAAAIPELLDGQLEWPLFMALHPHLAATAANVRLFHTISCLYFATGSRFHEATFAYAICREAGASPQELSTLSHTLERQLSADGQWDALLDWLGIPELQAG